MPIEYPEGKPISNEDVDPIWNWGKGSQDMAKRVGFGDNGTCYVDSSGKEHPYLPEPEGFHDPGFPKVPIFFYHTITYF